MSGVSVANIRYFEQIQYPPIVGVLYNYFALPFLDACIIILFVRNIVQNRSILSYFAPLALLVVSVVSNGARLAVFQLVVAVVFSIFLCKKVSFKVFVSIAVFAAVAIIVFVVITSDRGGGESIGYLFESAYNYFCGSIIFADSVIINEVGMDGFLYGINSFGGLLRPLFAFLEIFGFDEPELLNRAGLFMAESMQDYNIPINSSGEMFNYFCTCFIYFYKDGGYVAVGIVSFVYGLISSFSFSRLIGKKRFIDLIIYLFVIISIFTSMMHFSFSYFIFVMSIVYVVFLLKKPAKIQSVPYYRNSLNVVSTSSTK